MTFAQPSILFLLLLLPLLAGLKLAGDVRSRRAAERVSSPRLLPGLLIRRGRNRGWLVTGLELGAMACFIVALARPQYGFLEESPGSGGRSLLVAIDTSRSMLTDDLKPSRLKRTQLAATDLIRRLRGDRIGLMPFAGTAYLYAPITPDLDALLESIDSLDTEIIPRGGSNLSRPIELAIETFEKSGMAGQQQVLIIFSDGESLEGATLDAARRAREANITIITIGVGTQAGALIPDEETPGGYYRDPEGKPVLSRLQPDVLLDIANLTGGLYLPLNENGVNDRRIDAILDKLKRTAMKGKMTRKTLDRYRWPLGAGLLLLTGAWIAGIVRRHRPGRSGEEGSGNTDGNSGPVPVEGTAPVPAAGAAVLTGLLMAAGGILIPETASAGSRSGSVDAASSGPGTGKAGSGLPAGNPWAFYQQGNYKAALHNFNRRLAPESQDGQAVRAPGDPALEFGRGAAAFREGDFDTAVNAFGAAVLADSISLRADAHFNLANAIYQRTADLAKKAKPRTLAKLSFIDGLIRQLENSLENYQQALILKPGNADIQANHDTTDKLIQELRNLREAMAKMQGQGKGRKKGEDEGEGEGEGDGSPGNGKGRGKGKGKGKPGGQGNNGEEQEGGAGGPESEEEAEARRRSNEEKEGSIGEEGEGQGGEEEGEGEGEGDEGEKDGNQSGKGERQDDGEPGGEEGSTDSQEDAENAVNPGTGFSPSEAKRQLEQLSDEDLNIRPRIEEGRETRPARDW